MVFELFRLDIVFKRFVNAQSSEGFEQTKIKKCLFENFIIDTFICISMKCKLIIWNKNYVVLFDYHVDTEIDGKIDG